MMLGAQTNEAKLCDEDLLKTTQLLSPEPSSAPGPTGQNDRTPVASNSPNRAKVLEFAESVCATQRRIHSQLLKSGEELEALWKLHCPDSSDKCVYVFVHAYCIVLYCIVQFIARTMGLSIGLGTHSRHYVSTIQSQSIP